MKKISGIGIVAATASVLLSGLTAGCSHSHPVVSPGKTSADQNAARIKQIEADPNMPPQAKAAAVQALGSSVPGSATR